MFYIHSAPASLPKTHVRATLVVQGSDGDTGVLQTGVRSSYFRTASTSPFQLRKQTNKKGNKKKALRRRGDRRTRSGGQAQSCGPGARKEPAGREDGRPTRQPPAQVGRSGGRTWRRCRRRPGGRGSSLGYAGRPCQSPGRQQGSGRGYCGPGPAGEDVASEPGSALTMMRPQVGRAALLLCRGSGYRPEKRSSGRSGPAAPDRSLRRFASFQDGGPKPRLQPETARVKGRGAGPTGSFWVAVNSVLR